MSQSHWLSEGTKQYFDLPTQHVTHVYNYSKDDTAVIILLHAKVL